MTSNNTNAAETEGKHVKLAVLLPAKGSLRAILLENSTTRLYTHPLEWTATHLQNLSCHLRLADKISSSTTETSENDLPAGLTWQ